MENTTNKLQTFNFYRDEKVTMWQRGKFEIEAETYEEAVKLIKEMEENPIKYNEVDIRWEDLAETIEELTPEDNHLEVTLEIYSEDTNELVYDNGDERTIPPRIPVNK